MNSRSSHSLVLSFLALLVWSPVASAAVGPYAGWINDMKEDASGRILAAGSFGGVYRSSDAGESWQQIYDGTLIFDPLSVATNAAGDIFVGSEGFLGVGFLRSTDDGASWQLIANALASRGARDLLVTGSGEIFACTFSSGVYRSTDNGTTFTAVSSLPVQSPNDIEATPGGTLLVGTRFDSDYMYRSTDNGATWQVSNSGLTGEVADIFVAGANEIYAATSLAVYKSTDDGATWVNVEPPNPSYSYASVAQSGGDIYVGYSGIQGVGGVLRSTDGGATWVAESGLPAKAVGKLLRASNGVLFGGGRGHGVFRRGSPIARGVDWEWKNNGLANTWVTSIGEDVAGGIVYAATAHAQMFRSMDAGSTWESASSGIPAYEWIYSVAVNIDGTVFAAGAYGNIYRSTDQGASWASTFALTATAIACNAQGHVFAGSGSRMYRSTNNGSTWTFGTLSSVQNVADIAFDGDIVLAATGTSSGFGSRGVYRSTDNGSTWAAFNAGLPTMDVVTIAARADAAASMPGGCRYTLGTLSNGMHDYDSDQGIWTPVTGLPNTVAKCSKKRRNLAAGRNSYHVSGLCSDYDQRFVNADIKTIDDVSPGGRVAMFGTEGVILVGTVGYGIVRDAGAPTGVGDGASSDGAGVGVALDVAAPIPNPFSDASTLSFSIPESGPVRVDLFDVSGRIVRTLFDGAMARGPHALVWDGRNAAGRDVGAGVYFYRLTAGAATSTRRAVLTR